MWSATWTFWPKRPSGKTNWLWWFWTTLPSTGPGPSKTGERGGGEGACALPLAGVLPASEPHRESVAQAQGLLDAQALLRIPGRVEAGHPTCSTPAGSCGASVSAWRYLAGWLAPENLRLMGDRRGASQAESYRGHA